MAKTHGLAPLCLFSSVEGNLSRGKRERSRSGKCANSVRKEISHVYLEQKAELAVQGECAAQKRFSEAEAEMVIRNWEQRNDIALYETNRELESQKLELSQANQWADQAQREKVFFSWRIGNEKRTLERKSRKKLRNYEESVAKKQIEQDN